MYKVGDLLVFPDGARRGSRPIGMVIRTISPPRPRDGCTAEVKPVLGGSPSSEPALHQRSFFIRDGNMEIISRVDVR